MAQSPALRRSQPTGEAVCAVDFATDFSVGYHRGLGVLACAEADGIYYDGAYKDDKMHGEGACIFADGSTYDGKWINGKVFWGAFGGGGLHCFVTSQLCWSFLCRFYADERLRSFLLETTRRSPRIGSAPCLSS